MAKRANKWTLGLLFLALFIQGTIAPVIATPAGNGPVEEQVQALASLSLEWVDEAIYILNKGWAGMTPAEQALFSQLYDPGNTGKLDDRFVANVLANYQKVRQRLDSFPAVAYRPDSGRCEDQRLYYTDLFKIYVCPYFIIEGSTDRKARVLIHEAVHMALLAGDRPYFHKNTYSTRYRALTPRGSWTAAIPLLGYLFREIAHDDTLYHPDAYAWFAVELAALGR